MKKKYRHYPLEYKQQVIQEIESGQRTQAAVCREEQLSSTMIDRWRRQAKDGQLRDHSTARERQLERELERYKKKVGELSMENDLLKKIEEYSVHMRKSNGYVVTGRNMVSKKDVK
jgi:transposase-like protein